MSATVRDQLLKFALAVDPRTKNDVVFTSGTIGTVDGDKFPAQRLLDMYNDARMLAAYVISYKKSPREAQEACQNVVRKSDAAIASGVLEKPEGYVLRKTLMTASGKIISLLPIEQLPFTSRYEALNNQIMYEEKDVFRSAHGNTFIPDANNYLFIYMGITAFTLADVTGGTVKETFSPIYESVLIQIAVAIAGLQGQEKPLAIAEQLIGGQ